MNHLLWRNEINSNSKLKLTDAFEKWFLLKLKTEAVKLFLTFCAKNVIGYSLLQGKLLVKGPVQRNFLPFTCLLSSNCSFNCNIKLISSPRLGLTI